MSELPLAPLSQLLSLINSRTAGDKNASMPYVGLEHIPSAGSTLLSVGSAADSISTNGVFTSGDILFGKLRPQLHKCVRVTVFGYCSTDILVLRPNAGINPAYAGYIAQSDTVFRAAIRTEEGTKMPRCSWHDLKSVKVLLPNEPVQQKVASILSSLDTAIEKTEALIAKHQQIKAGLMHDLFTRGVLPNGQLRPPRNEAPELYQETAIGWIPKDWEVKLFSDVLESIADGPFGSNLKTEHYVTDAGVRVVRLQNVAEFEYNDGDRAFVSDRHAAYLARNKVVAGDVLIAGLGDERYPVGRACTYPDNLPPAINKADCFRGRCLADVMHNRFFMLFLNTELARQQIRRFEQGVTRPRINTGNIKRLLIGVPTLNEQSSFIERFEASQTVIQSFQRNVEVLAAKKLGLMQDLLTGKVPVKIDGQTSATSDQALEQKVLARMGGRAQAMEVDIDAI